MNTASAINYLLKMSCYCFGLTQSFDLTPLPMGACLGGGGPSVPTLISSTLAAVRKTGTAGMSNSDRASGTTWALFQE